jgi:SAM-dependent methyltransferase
MTLKGPHAMPLESVKKIARRILPQSVRRLVRGRQDHSSAGPSQLRVDSNRWLRSQCRDIVGAVLSIGSGDDNDGEGGKYRDYLPGATSYTTSEWVPMEGCDLVIDVRSMPEITDASYDCVYCSGVLEHVDEFRKGFDEITRILKSGGILLLGLPFRQAIHMAPHDFWRFTEYGIKFLLKDSYEILVMTEIGTEVEGFPGTYWVKARKQPQHGTNSDTHNAR